MLALVLVVFLFPGQIINQPAPGGIVLLPGYQYEGGQGRDSWVGRIWKKGLVIRHDIGGFVGTFVSPKDKAQYFHFTEELGAKQVMWWGLMVPGHRPQKRGEALAKVDGIWPKELWVSFSCHANFIARVRSQQDIDETLQMLRTFRCDRLAQ
jgi:hypothetical protein